MPWKPNSVGDSHDHRWARISQQKRKGEPLCRLCHAGGRIVPAAVVDHILPLADGGTHEESNLMPLCKRCHDAIKTPTDLRVRERAERAQILVYAIGLGGEYPRASKEWLNAKKIDYRNFRRSIAKDFGFDTAHLFMLNAIEGILTARKNGELPPCRLILVQDDAGWTNQACARFQIEVEVDSTESIWDGNKFDKAESEWLRKRYGNEYAARHKHDSRGTQSETT